jgi:anti-anti-sigma factor
LATALSITSTRLGRVAVCVATGDIDVSTIGDLREAVLAGVTDADSLRLDLSGVAFIDTTGLGTLLELRSTLQSAGAGFEITAADGPVRQAVEITGLAHLLA